ncbi:hypothetical protein ACP8Y2_13830 [Herpetosiphon llansteffanensis]
MRNVQLRILLLVGLIAGLSGGLGLRRPVVHAVPSATSQLQPPPARVAVTTRSFDNARTGTTAAEQLLAPTNVVSNTFGKLFSRTVDGQIYAQPLYVPDLTMPGVGVRNVVFVATQKNNVYAFDADDPAMSAPLWSLNLGQFATSSLREFGTRYNGGVYQDIKPYVGITGSPVIDTATNTLYVVPFIRLGAYQYQHRMVAINILTGAIIQSTTIQGSVPGDGNDANPNDGLVVFDSRQHLQRASLLLDGNRVYVAFAGYADTDPYHGWVFGYNKTTLQRELIYNTTPQKEVTSQPNAANDGEGGIWMSGQGLTSDGQGNLYLSIGNGSWNANLPNGRDYGSSVSKLNISNPLTPTVQTWFTPYDYKTLNTNDTDLGTTGAILIPNTNVMIAGSKGGKIYVFNRNDMGGLGVQQGTTGFDKPVAGKFYQSFKPHGGSGFRGIFGSPVVWAAGGSTGTRMFVWPVNSPLKAFQFSTTQPLTPSFITTPVATSTLQTVQMPGGVMSLSWNGTNANTGIVWATHSTGGSANTTTQPGVLRAYNALTLQEAWNSNQIASRDAMGNLAKFNTPLVADGKVIVGTFSVDSITNTDKLVVYGHLAPRIVREPVDTTVSFGQNASLNVTATGAANLSYQWYRGATGNTSNPIAGAISPTLTLTNVQTNSQVWVRVSNQQGNVASITASVMVTNIPTNTPTNTSTPTNTPTPSNTPTNTNTPTPSNTPTITNTPVVSQWRVWLPMTIRGQ